MTSLDERMQRDAAADNHVTDCENDLGAGCVLERWFNAPADLVALVRRYVPDAPDCVVNRIAELATDAYARGYVDAVEHTTKPTTTTEPF